MLRIGLVIGAILGLLTGVGAAQNDKVPPVIFRSAPLDPNFNHVCGFELARLDPVTGDVLLVEGMPEGEVATAIWSPDGERIAFVIDTEGGCGFGDTIGRLYVMDADGSNMRALFDEPRVIGHLRWGPDSARLAYVTHTGEAMRASDSIDIIVIDAADGAELQRWPGLEPAWTPDGAQIIFFRAQPDDPNFVDLYAYDLLDGTERALDARPGNIEQFDIAPDSATIAYTYYEIINNVRQGGLFAVDLADGEPRSLTEEQDGHALVYSPDGTMIAFEGLEGGFYLMNADGSDLRAVTTSETQGFRAAAPIWSPDGTMFAFDLPSTAPDLEYRPYTLHVYDVSAETVTNLSPGILTESGHQWSPNSDQIIFMGKQPEGGADLYSVRVNDSNAPRNLTESADRFEMTPDWQPDGDD